MSRPFSCIISSMNGDSVESAIVLHRPPAPEEPLAVRQERERQSIFHSFEPGSVAHNAVQNPSRAHQPIPDSGSGPIGRGDACVLDERGGHRILGRTCTHRLGWNDPEVHEVEM